MPTRRRPKPFTAGQMEAVCQVLADTNEGLTGSEIGQMLRQVRVSDVDPTNTKWKRLFNALAESQERTRSGDRVLAFVSHALEPARYQGNSSTLEERRDRVNVVLLLYDGLGFRGDGKFHKTKKASSLPEAQQRASRLRSALERREVHPDVLRYCSAEFLGDNPFHASRHSTNTLSSPRTVATGKHPCSSRRRPAGPAGRSRATASTNSSGSTPPWPPSPWSGSSTRSGPPQPSWLHHTPRQSPPELITS